MLKEDEVDEHAEHEEEPGSMLRPLYAPVLRHDDASAVRVCGCAAPHAEEGAAAAAAAAASVAGADGNGWWRQMVRAQKVRRQNCVMIFAMSALKMLALFGQKAQLVK